MGAAALEPIAPPIVVGAPGGLGIVSEVSHHITPGGGVMGLGTLGPGASVLGLY